MPTTILNTTILDVRELGLDLHACDNPPRKIPHYCLNQSTLVIKQE
jgi:hypothetical protein